MSYRKLRKAYCRRYGFFIKLTFKLKKTGRIARKESKKATAIMLKEALYKNMPVLGSIGMKKI